MSQPERASPSNEQAPDETRRFVRRFCELYIQKLRGILYAHPPKDSPCASCAFAPSTDDSKGFESTICHLMQAMINGRAFYCHRNLQKVDGEYVPNADLAGMILCANYEAIRACPEVKDALLAAAVESEPMRKI